MAFSVVANRVFTRHVLFGDSQEGVGDIFPDIKFKLTYKIVEKAVVTPSSPTDVPSLVRYSVLDPLQTQEVTSVVSWPFTVSLCE